MKGIEIDGSSADAANLDLIDLLTLSGVKGQESSWTCADVKASGETADSLHQALASRHRIRGGDLFELTRGLTETASGLLEAYYRGAREPWLVIEVIANGHFKFFTDNAGILAAVTKQAGVVNPIG